MQLEQFVYSVLLQDWLRCTGPLHEAAGDDYSNNTCARVKPLVDNSFFPLGLDRAYRLIERHRRNPDNSNCYCPEGSQECERCETVVMFFTNSYSARLAYLSGPEKQLDSRPHGYLTDGHEALFDRNALMDLVEYGYGVLEVSTTTGPTP